MTLRTCIASFLSYSPLGGIVIPGSNCFGRSFSVAFGFPAVAQTLIKPAVAGDPVVLLPSDMATLESPAETERFALCRYPPKDGTRLRPPFSQRIRCDNSPEGTLGGRRVLTSYFAYIPRAIKGMRPTFPALPRAGGRGRSKRSIGTCVKGAFDVGPKEVITWIG